MLATLKQPRPSASSAIHSLLDCQQTAHERPYCAGASVDKAQAAVVECGSAGQRGADGSAWRHGCTGCLGRGHGETRCGWRAAGAPSRGRLPSGRASRQLELPRAEHREETSRRSFCAEGPAACFKGRVVVQREDWGWSWGQCRTLNVVFTPVRGGRTGCRRQSLVSWVLF